MSRTGKGAMELQPEERPKTCEHEDASGKCSRRVDGKNRDLMWVCSFHMRPVIPVTAPASLPVWKSHIDRSPPRPRFPVSPLPAMPEVSPPPVEEHPAPVVRKAREKRVPREKPARVVREKPAPVAKKARALRTLEVEHDHAPDQCKIVGCERKQHSRGLCAACYVAAQTRGVLEEIGDSQRLRGRNGFFREVEHIIFENPGIRWAEIMQKTGRSKPEVGAAVGYLRGQGRVAKAVGAGPHYGRCYSVGAEPVSDNNSMRGQDV